MKEKSPFSVFFFLTAFLILTCLVVKQVTRPFDLSIAQWVHGFGTRSLDYAMTVFTLLGSVEFSTFAILVVTWYWYRKYEWPGAFIYFFLFATFSFMELVLKHLIASTGPGPEFDRTLFQFGFISLRTPYSFPSGHTFRSVFLFGMYGQWLNRSHPNASFKLVLQKMILAALIFCVCFSRVYLGDHWTSDVVGGFLLAALALAIVPAMPHPELRPA